MDSEACRRPLDTRILHKQLLFHSLDGPIHLQYLQSKNPAKNWEYYIDRATLHISKTKSS